MVSSLHLNLWTIWNLYQAWSSNLSFFPKWLLSCPSTIYWVIIFCIPIGNDIFTVKIPLSNICLSGMGWDLRAFLTGKLHGMFGESQVLKGEAKMQRDRKLRNHWSLGGHGLRGALEWFGPRKKCHWGCDPSPTVPTLLLRSHATLMLTNTRLAA